jgi:hypothetical protein
MSRQTMIELPYSLLVEATDEPDFFGSYSPDPEGFPEIGHWAEDCHDPAYCLLTKSFRFARAGR